MGMKKGIYFTIDSIIAGGIILSVIILTSFFYIIEQQNVQLNFLSYDIITILSTLTVEEINNEYVNSLIGDGTITDPKRTVLEQVSIFWAQDEIIKANKTIRNITYLLISNKTGFGLFINNESVYNKNNPIKKSLISSKTYISGINKGQATFPKTRENLPTLWGPVVVEVRIWE